MTPEEHRQALKRAADVMKAVKSRAPIELDRLMRLAKQFVTHILTVGSENIIPQFASLTCNGQTGDLDSDQAWFLYAIMSGFESKDSKKKMMHDIGVHLYGFARLPLCCCLISESLTAFEGEEEPRESITIIGMATGVKQVKSLTLVCERSPYGKLAPDLSINRGLWDDGGIEESEEMNTFWDGYQEIERKGKIEMN